jgi:hypothetical protein
MQAYLNPNYSSQSTFNIKPIEIGYKDFYQHKAAPVSSQNNIEVGNIQNNSK